MQTQNLSNHRQIVWGYYLFPGLLLLAVVIGAIINLVNASATNLYSASLILALSITVFAIFFKARSFALKAQDRAIRAEENFRHFVLTGKPLDRQLTIGQIIALRFASDEELPSLAKRAIAEGLSNKAIKEAIINWRGDFYRV
ncbi:MAG TPA: DUF6526 family protein [Flavisolibacter sp.]|nr:DUF6526 family protein [Flavisolibacter sp.]